MEQYERLKVLGVGSFGKVYLMRHRQQRRLVCAKIIRVKNIPRKEREACRTEVDLMRRLHHPNIVGYKDSFLTPRKDHLCIIMEYCDGGDLSTQIKNARRRLFPESKILHWFVQIALGLHYMHGRLILHRDLKTQNIFLLGNGRLVLGDLGISKVLEGTMDFASTRIGTPYYMSPELFNNKPYNHKSDIWALGCVLYEMAALAHAFDADSLHGLAQRVAKGRYPSIHVKYSRHLRDLISRMLSTSPAQRPDLDQILQLGFIRKHIHNFLADIVSRESHKIGEGTMVLKAAAVNMLADAEGPSSMPHHSGRGDIVGLGSNQDMLALKRQMEELGLQEEVKRALNPPKAIRPADPRTAAKVVKEQTGALRREEDRRKAVEAALARLRKEREERLRLRHAEEGRVMPPLPPPQPAPAPAPASANSNDGDLGGIKNAPNNRIGGAWQVGVVGVGVSGAAAAAAPGSDGMGSPPDEGRGRRGGVGAGRQPEAGGAWRVGGLLVGVGMAKEGRQGRAAGSPDVRAQIPRSREGRRSLEPRAERREVLDRKTPSRLQHQNRRRSFGGGGGRSRASSPGEAGGAGAAAGGSGGGLRARRNSAAADYSKPDQVDVARVKDLDKFSRAREAERLAAEAMIRRDEASSREALRKREEAVRRERERDRLRQDKVELDRKMLERERQRRQRAAAAASKAAAVKAKEAREALQCVQNQRKSAEQQEPDRLEVISVAPAAPSPPPTSSTATSVASGAGRSTQEPLVVPLTAGDGVPAPASQVSAVGSAMAIPTSAPAEKGRLHGPGSMAVPASALAEQAETRSVSAGPGLPQPPSYRIRARWALGAAPAAPPAPPAPPATAATAATAASAASAASAAGIGNSSGSALLRAVPAAPAPPTVVATSAVWEVIERRKREKADLEEAVARKEGAMAGGASKQATENQARGRPEDLPPAPPPRPPASTPTNGVATVATGATHPALSAARDSGNPPLVPGSAGRGDNGDSNSNSSVKMNNSNSPSPCATDSEEGSEDSENLPWGVKRVGGSDRQERAMRIGAMGSGFAVALGVGGDARKWPRGLDVGEDVGRGTRARGGDSRFYGGDGAIEDEDEADEDIHAREELLQEELQAATTRCQELRHTLQETKSMIPAKALVVVDDGGGKGGGDGHETTTGVRSGGHRRRGGSPKQKRVVKDSGAVVASGLPASSRIEVGGGHDDDQEGRDEEDEEDEEDGVGSGDEGGEEGDNKRTTAVSAGGSSSDSNSRRNSFRGGLEFSEEGRPSRVRRAWGGAASDSRDVDGDGALVPGGAAAAFAAAVGPRNLGAGVMGGVTSSGEGVIGGGGEEGKVNKSTGETDEGGRSDSSEASRNSFYPYDQGELETEAKALNGHGEVIHRYGIKKDGGARSEKLFQRRPPARVSETSSSSTPSAFDLLSAAAAAAAAAPVAPSELTMADGKHSRDSGVRETKRTSRLTPPATTAIPVSPPPPALESSSSATSAPYVDERPEAINVDASLVAAAEPAQAAAQAGARSTTVEHSPSPPRSAPAGRLADRIRTLRQRCCLGLGAEAFERAYEYLKEQEELDELSGEITTSFDVDREERLVRGLTDIVGQNKIHYYSLIDQLIFIENTHIGSG